MNPDQPLPDEMLASPVLASLRDALEASDYTEGALSELLGIEAPAVRTGVSRESMLWRARGLSGALPVLARLFFLGDEVERDELAPVLEDADVASLLDFGVLAPGRNDDQALRAPIGVTPCRGRYVLADSLAIDAEAVYGEGGPSMGPGPDSECLLRTTPRRPIERVLDLCTGPGTHALVAGRHADEVVGVDMAPRALTFARVNAALNGAQNVRYERVDVVERAVPGGPFELVLANPPFVPNPHPELLYRDGGGELGDQVLNAIIEQLDGLLVAGGEARIITDVAFRAGETLESKLVELLGERLDALDVFCIEETPFDLADYAEFHSLRLIDGRLVQEPAAAIELLDYYERVGINRIAAVLLSFRKVAGGGRRLFRRVASLLDVRAEDVERVFSLWTAMASDADLVARAVPTARDGVCMVHRRTPGDAAPERFEVELGPGSPWAKFRTNAALCEVLYRCDAVKTGATILNELAQANGRPPEALQGFVTKALLSLAELGALDFE